MANFIMGVISLTIGVILVANVLIAAIKNTSTTGWTSSETVMWSTLSLIVIVGLLYGVMQVFGIM